MTLFVDPRANRSGGFTLIEVLIVVAVIAILAAIAIPNLLSARINANEEVAVATLKCILTAQAQIASSAYIDANGDSAGEYAYFQELTGKRGVRQGHPASSASTILVSPPILSPAYGSIDNGGRMSHAGYFFELYLPGAGGSWLSEEAPAAAYPAVDAVLAGGYWACYAWPAQHGRSGNFAFFVSQSGEILAARNSTTRYSGGTTTPSGDAALDASATNNTLMTHSIAVNATGTDGNFWIVVN